MKYFELPRYHILDGGNARADAYVDTDDTDAHVYVQKREREERENIR